VSTISLTEHTNVVIRKLFAPVDIASLVYFRILFGSIMIWEVFRFFSNGWIARYYINPTWLFKYSGFEWVNPWPGYGMYLHFYGLGILALMIALGFFYRVAAALFFLGFTYVFLLAESKYLNHFYFLSLTSFLLIFVPAHKTFSLDALRDPGNRSSTAPTWALWALRAQIGIVYCFGGIAKINMDWLRAEPIRDWLATRSYFPVIGQWFTEEWMVYLFAYGGLMLDLLAPFALLWRPTRFFALGAITFFHLTNSQLFGIGIFPWFTLGASLLFMPPDWPRLRWLRKRRPVAEREYSTGVLRLERSHRVIGGFLAVYFLIQVLVPLRHHLYPGNVSWTEEGHNFAWHMKLRDKDSSIKIYVTDPATGDTRQVDLDDFLTDRQQRKMSTRPRMILKFSHYLAERYDSKGVPDVQVRTKVMTSLNGREPQLLIDPKVDLARERNTFLHAKWILPLTQPLKPEN